MRFLPIKTVKGIKSFKIENFKFDNISEAKAKVTQIARELWGSLRTRMQLNYSWAMCMKAAWNLVKLNQAAKKGIIYFSFRRLTDSKTSGEKAGDLRFAMATLNKDFINYEFKGGAKYVKLQFRFYDTIAGAWRSCRVETVEKVFWASEDSE